MLDLFHGSSAFKSKLYIVSFLVARILNGARTWESFVLRTLWPSAWGGRKCCIIQSSRKKEAQTGANKEQEKRILTSLPLLLNNASLKFLTSIIAARFFNINPSQNDISSFAEHN